MAHLADKMNIAAFARPEVAQSSLEAFEDKFSAGRAWHDDFHAVVTRSFSNSTVDKLAALCLREFAPESNKFHPSFFIVLDDRTNRDGSVTLYHQRTSIGDPEELRVSPMSLPALLSVMNVGMRDIPYIKANEALEDPETGFHNVPIDNSATHQTARVATQHCAITTVGEHFRKVAIPAERVAEAGLPEGPVELEWFGDIGPSVLLFSCWEADKPGDKFVMGQQRA